MNELLTAVGAIIGILVGLTSLLTYARRRRRIRVASSTVLSDHNGVVEITVTNLGGDDVTLTDIGFAIVHPPAFGPVARALLSPVYNSVLGSRFGAARRYSNLGVEDGEIQVVRLKPSQPVTRSIPMEYAAGWITAEEVAWPYATDSSGRDHYSDRPADVYSRETDS